MCVRALKKRLYEGNIEIVLHATGLHSKSQGLCSLPLYHIFLSNFILNKMWWSNNWKTAADSAEIIDACKQFLVVDLAKPYVYNGQFIARHKCTIALDCINWLLTLWYCSNKLNVRYNMYVCANGHSFFRFLSLACVIMLNQNTLNINATLHLPLLCR